MREDVGGGTGLRADRGAASMAAAHGVQTVDRGAAVDGAGTVRPRCCIGEVGETWEEAQGTAVGSCVRQEAEGEKARRWGRGEKEAAGGEGGGHGGVD